MCCPTASCDPGYIIKLEVRSKKPGSKSRKNATQVGLHDGEAWATVKWYDAVEQPASGAAVAATALLGPAPGPAGETAPVASAAVATSVAATTATATGPRADMGPGRPAAAQCKPKAGDCVGAYFTVDGIDGKRADTWFGGRIDRVTKAGQCTVIYDDEEEMSYSSAQFVFVACGEPRPTCRALGGRPCILIEAAPVLGSTGGPQAAGKPPRRAPAGGNAASASGQAARGRTPGASPVCVVGIVGHERRNGCLAYSMQISSEHGLNYPAHVASSIVTPVRMAMAADGVFLLDPADELYVGKYMEMMNAKKKAGDKSATERPPTDFAARKSKFPNKR